MRKSCNIEQSNKIKYENVKNLKISKLKLQGIFVSVFLIAVALAAANANVNTNVNTNGNTNVGVIEISISPVKDVYYVDDEITIKFSVTPNKNGCFATLVFTKINGSIDTLFQHEGGCMACGLVKPPLTSKTSSNIKKKFYEPGIYEVQGIITDASTYEKDYRTIKIIVNEKNKYVENKSTDEKNMDGYTTNVPIVIELFTRDGCPICYHVDEGVNKLANEYNERVKNSVIILEYHLHGTQANRVGLDRRVFYHGDKWQNVCNYYSLTLINGEDGYCGGARDTESNYRNLKNKVENKNLAPTVSMRANASHNKDLLYINIEAKSVDNVARNLDIYAFILDGINVKAYLQRSAKTDKKQTASVNFSFPYNELVSAHENLKIVVLVQEDKKILNARVIEWKDVKEIKNLTKEKKDVQNMGTYTAKNNTYNARATNIINSANNTNTTNTSNTNTTNTQNNANTTSETYFATTSHIDFIYCAASREMLYCAFKFAFYNKDMQE